MLAVMIIAAPFANKASAEEAKLDSKVNVKLNGVYNVWGISQNNFFFGANGPLAEKDDYIVQMLRLKLELADKDEDIKVVTRFDLAQGWWGVDNAGDQGFNGGQFHNKSTFFDFHVDHAYLDFKAPLVDGTRVAIGRMHFALGNKLVLDDDVDGMKISTTAGPGKITLSYGKFFEGDVGTGTCGTPVAPITSTCVPALGALNDRGNAGDSNMFIAQYDQALENGSFSAWYLYYSDQGTGDGTAYITNGLTYNRPRFTPQVSSLNIFGASVKYTLGQVTITAEGDYLSGKDDINNLTYNANRNDINNGTLDGATFYADLNYKINGQVNIGVKYGYGTGDKDQTGGKGNITKLKTQGFFYFTEVWEDSIMPDVAGITPQGLGAPNTQGYREFENTTAFQVYANYKPVKWMNLFASYSVMTATEMVTGFTGAGPNAIQSDKLGSEIDGVATIGLYSNLQLQARVGYFVPGEAAKLLVNGTNVGQNKKALEFKSTLTYKF